ncbi:MAG TPA: DUF4159 domain-containing protein [Gemmatimonas aurantiaca]|uniref:DUF4159 domain-containing protein n=1 Tax=Gemmatimonas aurantiaca TaxID=173480 RepID=A0A3D4V9Q1_9BACT|nr:DUF4159 domain-containing protein [Gemmatimonas aurantiaca]HCT57850.1 DUF4159 domain-containing protein [Gemmatimonas aurantiaca]
MIGWHRDGDSWTRRALVLGMAWAALTVAPATLDAQGRRGGGRQPEFADNVPYDGRLTFARIRYTMPDFGGFRGRDLPWSHDYPRGERHFTKIVSEITSARVRTMQSNILTLDDPQLGKYPIAYMAEAGFWVPNEAETLGMRHYLTKGGFMVFDDFAGDAWRNFEAQMRKVLPDLRPIELTVDHPIFDSFYRIKSLDYYHPYYRMKSVFYGYFEGNDPKKRMLAIVNYNNDLSEYWEFSDQGMFPLDMSNESYKLGVNYIVYALTR